MLLNAASMDFRLMVCSLALATTSACTVLGPMPAVTGASPLPANRPGGELQAGAVPGFYLSSTVRELPEGTPIAQAAAMIEPGEAIDLPGASAGARYVHTETGDGYVEPMLRYRGFVDDEERFAASVVGYGAHASGAERRASYQATRAGLELSADVRLTPSRSWFELHAFATVGALGLFADGHYCLDAEGKYGVDCPEPGDPPGLETDAEVDGLFPTAAGGVALDIARHLDSVFHGGRIALMGGGGTMPRVVGGEQTGTQFYAAGGLTATLSFGAP